MSEFKAIEISLSPTGDAESSFHQRNKPGQFQRPHVIQSGSEQTAKCDIVCVVHGKYSPGGPPATIIIFDFRFITTKPSRRFRRAVVTVRFHPYSNPEGVYDGDLEDLDPEIDSIAPEGVFVMNESRKQRESKISANLAAQAGTGTGGLGAGLSLGWERTDAFEVKDQETFIGETRVEGRDYGSTNTVRWTFNENKSQRSGISSFFRTAILIKPNEDIELYSASINIDADVDTLFALKTRIQEFRGRAVVDPVHFDQRLGPMGKVPNGLDLENLSDFNLTDIVFFKSTEGQV